MPFAPIASTGTPPTTMTPAGSSPVASGAVAGSGAGPRPSGRLPNHAATTRSPGAPAQSESAVRPKAADHTPGPDSAAAPIPVSAARAARDAAIAACTANPPRGKSGGNDPLILARRIAAALHAPDQDEGNYGFYWLAAVTNDGAILVANSYGLAYIPEGLQLPECVTMASADARIPVAERARWSTQPLFALQCWVSHHNTHLRAVIGAKERFVDSDPGVATVVLEPEDIPRKGAMLGRSRLEVVDPAAAVQLAGTTDGRLIDLLPPAPAYPAPAREPRPMPEVVDAKGADELRKAGGLRDLFTLLWPTSANADPPADRGSKLWFEVMKPMTSNAPGHERAHFRAFHAYAAYAREVAVNEAYAATNPAAQRSALANFLYWKHLDVAMGEAL